MKIIFIFNHFQFVLQTSYCWYHEIRYPIQTHRKAHRREAKIFVCALFYFPLLNGNLLKRKDDFYEKEL